MKSKKETFNLFLTEREYRTDTLATFHFVPAFSSVKTTQPINLDGIRYKQNLETGEIDLYTREDYEYSSYCSIKRTKILLNMLLDMNDFDWFATLTFDQLRIDRTDDKAVYKAYVKYINNIKKQFPTLRYITVIERHEDGCIHFHLLIGGVTPAQLGLANSGKVCCHWAKYKSGICSQDYFNRTKHLHELKDTDGLTVYNITSFIYGHTTATRIASREKCNTYIKKYLDKALGSTDIFKKRFYYSSNLNTPKIVKRLIGSDFDEPKEIDKMYEIVTHDLVKHSTQQRVAYNTLQVRIDNTLKAMLDNGFTLQQMRKIVPRKFTPRMTDLVPVTDPETLKIIDEIF